MPDAKQIKAQLGESLVAQWLAQGGWTIECQSFRTRGAELDIVATKGSSLVLVEVKARSQVIPEALAKLLSAPKLRALKRGFESLIAQRPELIRPSMRLDLALKNPIEAKIIHYWVDARPLS